MEKGFNVSQDQSVTRKEVIAGLILSNMGKALFALRPLADPQAAAGADALLKARRADLLPPLHRQNDRRPSVRVEFPAIPADLTYKCPLHTNTAREKHKFSH